MIRSAAATVFSTSGITARCPVAATRTILLRTGLCHDGGVISLTVTLVALFGALAIWQVALRFGANFLFERPAAFWIAPKKTRPTLQAAE